jgi:hypothetical protein
MFQIQVNATFSVKLEAESGVVIVVFLHPGNQIQFTPGAVAKTFDINNKKFQLIIKNIEIFFLNIIFFFK